MSTKITCPVAESIAKSFKKLTPKFQVGDYAKSKKEINFMHGDRHVKDGVYLVTELTLAYYNVCQDDYEKVTND